MTTFKSAVIAGCLVLSGLGLVAGCANTPGKAMYDARTTKRAYRMMYDFFDEIL